MTPADVKSLIKANTSQCYYVYKIMVLQSFFSPEVSYLFLNQEHLSKIGVNESLKPPFFPTYIVILNYFNFLSVGAPSKFNILF